MSSSRKKAIFRKFSRDWVAGYLSADDFARAGQVEMLDLDGKVLLLDISDLKWICYVRDFNSGELNNPERLLRKTFAGRPRGEGLFVRATTQGRRPDRGPGRERHQPGGQRRSLSHPARPALQHPAPLDTAHFDRGTGSGRRDRRSEEEGRAPGRRRASRPGKPLLSRTSFSSRRDLQRLAASQLISA